MAAAIDVIIPIKGRFPLFPPAVDSLIAQSFPHWRAFVVDDGSSPEDRQAIAAQCARDPRITYMDNAPGKSGACAARNTAIARADSPYLIFFDSDDIMPPDALGERVRAIDAHPDLDFTVSPLKVFRKTPEDMQVLISCTRPGVSDLARFFRRDQPWLGTNLTWRRTSLDRVGHWGEAAKVWQDWEMSVRALCLGVTYRRIAGGTTYWRAPTEQGSIGREWKTPEYLRIQSRVIEQLVPLAEEKVPMTRELRDAICSLIVTSCRHLCEAGERREAARFWIAAGGPRHAPPGKAWILREYWKWGSYDRFRRIAQSIAIRTVPHAALPHASPFYIHGREDLWMRWETELPGY